MESTAFYNTYRPTYRSVYKTNKVLTVDSYVWEIGYNPMLHPKQFNIPIGTELIVNCYSNFGDGYSMQPRNPKKVLCGKGLTQRWFKVLFSDMEFVREEKNNC